MGATTATAKACAPSQHIPQAYRRAASCVDRILRGAKPGDLPVQFPTKFEMVVNLKTAKTLGVIPTSPTEGVG